MSLIADHYLSIGRNCEVGFQLKRVLGFEESNFFSWNVTYLDPLIALLESDFSEIARSENWVSDGHAAMLRDSFYNYGFHWVGNDAVNFRERPDLIAEQISKNAYLVDKFRTVMRSDKVKVLFHVTKEHEVKARALRVREALLKFGAKHFHIVVVQTEDRREGDWHEAHLSNRYIARLAPDEDAMDGHVDGWDSLFAEFPHRKPLRLAWRTPPKGPEPEVPALEATGVAAQPSPVTPTRPWWMRWSGRTDARQARH
jgi:hypothetical protein